MRNGLAVNEITHRQLSRFPHNSLTVDHNLRRLLANAVFIANSSQCFDLLKQYATKERKGVTYARSQHNRKEIFRQI